MAQLFVFFYVVLWLLKFIYFHFHWSPFKLSSSHPTHIHLYSLYFQMSSIAKHWKSSLNYHTKRRKWRLEQIWIFNFSQMQTQISWLNNEIEIFLQIFIQIINNNSNNNNVIQKVYWMDQAKIIVSLIVLFRWVDWWLWKNNRILPLKCFWIFFSTLETRSKNTRKISM